MKRTEALAQWSTRTGILPTHPTTERGAVSVVVDHKHEARPDLWHLTDYGVSSVSGIVVWLLPRETTRKQTAYVIADCQHGALTFRIAFEGKGVSPLFCLPRTTHEGNPYAIYGQYVDAFTGLCWQQDEVDIVVAAVTSGNLVPD